MLAMLFACGFRRSELVGLEWDEIQRRQGHWVVVDLIGKGGHVRTVPIPDWVKGALDQWTVAAGVTEGRIFRAVARTGKVWGDGISENVVWYVVKTCCEKAGLEQLGATCARCHEGVPGRRWRTGAHSLPFGDASVQTTARYLAASKNSPISQTIFERKRRTTSGRGIQCSTEDVKMSTSPSSNAYPYQNEPTWSRAEKAIARTAFDAALGRELHVVIQETKRMASQIRQSSDLWELEHYLTQRRKEIDRKYDYRYSRLTQVFGRLLYEGRVSEDDLSGLHEDKLKSIRSLAEFLATNAA